MDRWVYNWWVERWDEMRWDERMLSYFSVHISSHTIHAITSFNAVSSNVCNVCFAPIGKCLPSYRDLHPHDLLCTQDFSKATEWLAPFSFLRDPFAFVMLQSVNSCCRSRVNHPNILQLIDTFETRKEYLIIQELWVFLFSSSLFVFPDKVYSSACVS